MTLQAPSFRAEPSSFACACSGRAANLEAPLVTKHSPTHANIMLWNPKEVLV
jgi:hypothetical protein